ncbi:uncharacterized protein LOC123662721 [Melitaea cinxia]|uniref:uncharacterized protein LOC123662721 n=1 Tax=Melitaea cinxia TaxID=113334 RepID=UPI001E274405|nr:uncharacterized protein LOC123662721 [Melitaea cinxia]
MTKENIGTYSCEVRNEFDSIKRIFEIRSEACHLPKTNDYGENYPLILSHTHQLITQRSIGLGGKIFIYCPDSLLIYNEERLGSYISAYCINETRFLVNDKEYDISNIKCKEKIKPKYHKTNTACAPGNTELVQVRFEVKSQIFSVFDVCIDKDKYKIHFVRYIMHSGIANTSLAGASFTNNELLPLNFNDIYNCNSQLKSIYATTGEKLSKDGKCCFGKRQLVSPMDVLPGVTQETTYTYLNVVPVWSSCGQENWDEVERRVRSLVYDRDYALDVWTGSSHSLILPSTQLESQVELRLNDRYNLQQQVPLYLWKVISDRQEMSSLAIVLINYPNLEVQQALVLIRSICTDICAKTNWMKNSEWKKPNKGFVFCCLLLSINQELVDRSAP